MKLSTRQGIDRYVNDKCPTGSFLKAVLENNLMAAIACADIDNRADLFEICDYVSYQIPENCHGSPAKVRAWLDSK